MKTLSLLLLVGLLGACGDSTTEYALRDSIAIGPYTLTVRAVRDPWPNGILGIAGGQQGVVVFIRWSGTEKLADWADFVRSFHRDRLRLVDGTGKAHAPRSADSAAIYVRPGEPIGNPTPGGDWTAWFVLPEGRSDFTLRIENPDPAEGHGKIALVPLGR